MKRSKIVKRLVLAFCCVMMCFALNGQNTQAATKKSSYTIKKKSKLIDEEITVTGNRKKELTLKVKEKGTLKLSLFGVNSIGNKEQVKMMLVDKKGKKIASSTVKLDDYKEIKSNAFISYNVKPGIYKVVLTTKNIKKSKKRVVYFNYTMNEKTQVKADEKTVSAIANKHGNAMFTFVNDKDQVVLISDPESTSYEYSIYDSKGKWVCDSIWRLDIGDKNVHYLKKGTYRIKMKVGSYGGVNIKVQVQKQLSNSIITDAFSKEKAVVYDGNAVNFVHYGKQTKQRSQWMKVDTSRNDVYLDLRSPVVDDETDRTDYMVALYDDNDNLLNLYKYAINNHNTQFDLDGTWSVTSGADIKLKKGTGTYYLVISTFGTDIATITASSIR